MRSAEHLVRAAKSDVSAALEPEIRKRDAAAAGARESCLKALAALLIKHDLPDMKSDLQVALVGGARYACRLDATTAFGLEAALDRGSCGGPFKTSGGRRAFMTSWSGPFRAMP